MAAKMSWSLALLVMFVAASMQMPSHEAHSRVRRADEPAAESESTAAGDKEGATASTDSSGGVSPSGGGFSGIGGGGSGGSFPSGTDGIPGVDYFSKLVQSFMSNQPPGSGFLQSAGPFSGFLPQSRAVA